MPAIEPVHDALPPCVVIAVDDLVQQQVLVAVAAAHGLGALALARELRIEAAASVLPASEDARLWIVDLSRVHRESLLPARLTVEMRRVHPAAWLLFSHSARIAVNRWMVAWARNRGALGLIPALSTDRPVAIDAHLRPALELFGAQWRGVPATAQETAALAARERDHLLLRDLESRGWGLDALAAWARSAAGFPVRDAVWRGTTYRAAFVGREAAGALAEKLDLDRADATRVGELLRESRLFHHVKQEHAFADDELFYRFSGVTEKLDRCSLAHLLSDATGRGGFELRDRLYGTRSYPRCLIGAEAVEWMQRRYGFSEDEAITAGQAMIDLGVLAHVVDQHEFKNAGLYYEWRGFARAMVPAE